MRFPRTTFGWKLRVLYGSIALDSWGERIGKIISLVVIIAFAIGATFFFRSAFSRLLLLEGIGEPLLWRVISITMATVFGLLIISNLITGIATLYKSPEIPFLIARPVPFEKIFLGRFIDNLVYSSWSLAVLGVPIIIAWAWVYGLPVWLMIVLIVFGVVPLVLISAEIGTIILMGLVYMAKKTSPRITMFLVSILLLLIVGLAITQRSRGIIVEGAARDSTVEQYLAQLDKPQATAYIPSQWLVKSMRNARSGDYRGSLFLIALLTLTAAVWMRWIEIVAGRCYYTSWTTFSEITGRSTRSSSWKQARMFTNAFLPNPLNSILLKDILQFIRNPNQWGQFLILVMFLLVYLLNLVFISSRFNFDNPYYKTLVLFLNFAFSGFILATLSVRFVFPLMSLEGRGFWVVRKSPVSIKLLFWEKFLLAFIIFMILCELIVAFSNYVLKVSGEMMILTTVGTFMMGITLTGIAIGFGSLMPDFSDESPMRIASKPGGVLTVVLSLVYVGLMVSFLAWPTYGYFMYLTGSGPFPREQAIRALALVIGLNLLAFIIPIRLGRHAIQSRDL